MNITVVCIFLAVFRPKHIITIAALAMKFSNVIMYLMMDIYIANLPLGKFVEGLMKIKSLFDL